MISTQELIDAVVSHAQRSGKFSMVNGYEPKSAPGSDMTAAVWSQSWGPELSSGLAATSSRLVMNLRIYSNMIKEPQGMIDPQMLDAVDDLMTRYSADFTLDGLVRCVDLLGSGGEGLRAEAGYQEVGGTMFRIVTITLPLILNDSWEQVP